MVLPIGSGLLIVALWLAVAVAVGIYALSQILRHRTIPMTPVVVTASMAIGGIGFFPGVYMDHPLVNTLKLITIFIVFDLVVLSLVLRFRKTPATA